MKILKLENPTEKAQICENILRALPNWFGIESAILNYIADVKKMETWVVQDKNETVGFVSINKHNSYTAEIHVMGILENYQGKSLGSDLVKYIEDTLRNENFKFLTVKTLSASRPNEFYDKTRKFYLKNGFAPLEEFKTLWGEANPCLFMAKSLESR